MSNDTIVRSPYIEKVAISVTTQQDLTKLIWSWNSTLYDHRYSLEACVALSAYYWELVGLYDPDDKDTLVISFDKITECWVEIENCFDPKQAIETMHPDVVYEECDKVKTDISTLVHF